jgi:hypothetical protein
MHHIATSLLPSTPENSTWRVAAEQSESVGTMSVGSSTHRKSG